MPSVAEVPDRFRDERQTLIIARLRAEGRVSAPDLAKALKTSEDTVRRDLRALAERGLCRRVYGGAILERAPPSTFSERAGRDAAQKAALAKAALRLVEDAAFVFLDSGSTNLELARALRPTRRRIVATHAPAIALALEAAETLDVRLIGGAYDPREGACLGADALAALDALRPEVVTLGVCGLHAGSGVGAFNGEDAAFKRRLVAVSDGVVALVISDKLGARAPYVVCPLERLDAVVLEADAPDDWAERFAEAGVTVVRAQACA
jgi:DeoR/GlpR family transcriptional regulator of sugar metabolism